MTATNRFINVSGVSFTPTGGSATAIKGVQSANLDWNADDVSDGGDGDVINTTGVLVKLDPMVTLEFLNVMALSAVTPGAVGVLTFTMNDSRNAATTAGGAIIYTVSNAYLLPRSVSNQFRGLSKNTSVFKTFSTDGTTVPVASAAA